MKKILMLSAAILVMQATPVLAQTSEDRPRPKGEHHLNSDTNGDGVISKDEFLAEAAERFAKMDTDGNGSISKEEGMAFHKDMKGKHGDKKEKYGEMKEKRDGFKEKRQDRREDRIDPVDVTE